MSIAAMTKSELFAALKQHRREVERFTSHLKSVSGRVMKYEAMVSEYTARVQLRRGAAQRKAQQQLERAQDRLANENRILEDVVNHRNRWLRDIQQLENEYASAVVSVPVESSVSPSEEKEDEGTSATLMVRLLSGDVKEVEIDMFRPVVTFADEFAHQHGYNPSATGRMVFLIQSEEEEKENTVFWSPEVRHEGKVFIEVFGEILGDEFCQDDLPMLNLVIRPMAEDREMGAKVELIRKLLKEQSLNDNYDDETLFAMFGNWYLTYQPSGAGNRYLTMKAFVAQNGEAFWPMSEEEKVQQKEREEVRGFRDWLRDIADDILLRHSRSAFVHGDQFLVARMEIFEMLPRMIAQNNVPAMRHYCERHVYRYVHPLELHHMGVPAEVMCDCKSKNCRVGHMAEWLARSGPITLPESEFIVWRI